MRNREFFFDHIGQTSPSPLALEIVHAEGCMLTDSSGKKYIDLISGIAVSNLGHGNRRIVESIRKQSEEYLHLMVYGEFIESPQVQLARRLAGLLPSNLSSVYFVNSGAEAVEGAIKLARRHTGRWELVSFRNAYHGSTTGALALGGNEMLKNSFRPLMPGIKVLAYDDEAALAGITEHCAAVVVEPIQGESGVLVPSSQFLQALRDRCTETGALLVFDEIQTAMGRTGKLFAFEHSGVIPDILLLAKAFGGGMPLGAFIASKEIMSSLTHHPALGHITTFGGHPVCCAAALAALEQIREVGLMESVSKKEQLFRKNLQHPLIREFRGKGLFLSLQLPSEEINREVISACVANGVLVDWFLFAPHCLRIAPPLIISEDEIQTSCNIILDSLQNIARL